MTGSAVPAMNDRSRSYDRIYKVVARIPKGRVATYGQVAKLAGLAGHARQVGYALHALPGAATTPWQRVINARGEVSARAEPGMDQIQRQMLEGEGVSFNDHGRVDLARYQWRPRALGSGARAERGPGRR